MKTDMNLTTLIFILMSTCMLAQNELNDGAAAYEMSKKHTYEPEKRLKFLQTAVENNNADAMVTMGFLHYNGYGKIKKDNYPEALKYWSKAAAQQHPQAYFQLAILYFYGKGVEKDESKAVELWTQSAELGYEPAMETLGNFYFTDKSAKDTQKAYYWYKKAVDNGVTSIIPKMLKAEKMVEAEKTLQKTNTTDFEKGVAYFELEKGNQAIQWLEKAAKSGDDKAMTALGLAIEKWGMGFKKNKDIGKWYKKASGKGNEKAMYLLGKMYEMGNMTYSRVPDYINAMKWYGKAAEKGDTDALMAMGWLYNSGKHDVKPNNIYKRSGPQKWKAWDVFSKAAAQGHPDGYYAQGILLENGHFFVKDSKKYGYADAREFYEKAVAIGHEKAKQNLDRFNWLFEYNMGVKHFERKEYAEAKEMFEAADKKSGHLKAIKYLAQIHESGLGIEPNKKIAFNYYLRLARSGDIGSKSKVTQLYDNEPGLKSLVAQYQKEVASANKESMERLLAKLEKEQKQEAEYNEMLYQQELNRGKVTIGSQWQGFTYDAATRNSYNRTSAENNARIQIENYKRFLDYKFGK